jgi:hypothetical protein
MRSLVYERLILGRNFALERENLPDNNIWKSSVNICTFVEGDASYQNPFVTYNSLTRIIHCSGARRRKRSVSGFKADPSLSPLFKIDGADIKVNGKLDFETASAYTLKVKTTDSGKPTKSYTDLVHAKIADVNEEPESITPTTLTVNTCLFKNFRRGIKRDIL